MAGISGLSSNLFASTDAATAPAGPDELGKDTFLRLLTTQLQNQDPSEPMANSDFIAQLATFSNVEQLTGIKEVMSAAAMGIAALNSSSMASLLGTRVTAATDEFSYEGRGDVSLSYDAPTDVPNARVRVFDDNGSVIWSEEIGAVAAGEGTWTWDGSLLGGGRADVGNYRFEIVSEDGSARVDPRLIGVVDEMDYTGGSPRPSIGGVPVDIGDILSLQTGD